MNKAICDAPECAEKAISKGKCELHYRKKLKRDREPMTHEKLLRMLHYDPETGRFTRLVRCGRFLAGTMAGRKHCKSHGRCYIAITLAHHDYLAHRLAYFYMTGEWPRNLVDHRNGDGLDNRWENIRDAEPYQNSANMKVNRRNKIGLKGVRLNDSSKSSYSARITVRGRHIHLGSFRTPEEAHAAYCEAASRHSGEFYRVA